MSNIGKLLLDMSNLECLKSRFMIAFALDNRKATKYVHLNMLLVEGSTSSNSTHCVECAKRDRAVAGRAFDAVEMQSV
jgi:hypothetical protein